MNSNASTACVRLTVAIDRLCRAVDDNDRLRRKPAVVPEPLNDHCSQACLDAESFDLDYVIKATDALASMATHRARAIERLTDEIRETQP
jgi:hypothetical protein